MRRKNFEEVYHLWCEEKRNFVKQTTMATYRVVAESYLLKAFGPMRVITEGDLQAFVLKKMDEGFARKSVRDMLMVFRMVMRYAGKNRYMAVPPLDVQFPSCEKRSLLQVFSPVQQRVLMDHLNAHPTFRNIGLLLCMTTGMRIGEICSLRWEDIDLQAGIVRVRRTVSRIYERRQDGSRRTRVVIGSPKTFHSTRDIPLSNMVSGILRERGHSALPRHYLMSNATKPLEPHLIRSYYLRLLRKLGLPELKFHCLRHTFATRCIESGCDVKTVSTLLGHANISTTLNLYVHPTAEQQRQCIDNMMKLLEEKS